LEFVSAKVKPVWIGPLMQFRRCMFSSYSASHNQQWGDVAAPSCFVQSVLCW
jgi:hypothetical protein